MTDKQATILAEAIAEGCDIIAQALYTFSHRLCDQGIMLEAGQHQPGAIEGFGMHLGEKLDNIANAIGATIDRV